MALTRTWTGVAAQRGLTTSSGEVVFDGGHLEVSAVLNDGTTDVDLQVSAAGGDLLLGDGAVDLRDLLGKSAGVLVAGQVGVVKGHLAAGNHGDFHALVVLEPVEETLEGHWAFLENNLIVVGVAFGQHGNGAAHDGVELL